VLVVSTDNHLYCLDMRDGSVLWKFKAEGALTRMVVVYRGKVYLPSGRYIYCIDLEDGDVLWARRDQSIGFYGTPTVAEGKIFYGNRKGFYSRELLNGHLAWENSDIYTYGGFPSYWNGMVYTVSKEFQKETARLVALNTDDGTVRWEKVLENVSNIYSPVVYREKIYLAFGNRIVVFDAEDGEKQWEKLFLEAVASHPVFSHGNIYLSLREGTIIKLDPEKGNWEPLFTAPYATQFAVVGSYLFIPIKSPEGEMAVVDAETGREVRRVPSGEGEPSNLTVSRGIALLPSTNALVALGKGQFIGTVSVVPETDETGIAEGGRPETSEVGPGIPDTEGTRTGVLDSGEEETREIETRKIKGKVRDQITRRPLSGSVEATTRFQDGTIARTQSSFTGGSFEINIPREGETDLIISSKGFTFETITLPDEEAIDDLSKEGLDLTLSRTRRGEQIRLYSIHFELGRANLEPTSIPTLRKIHEMMAENPGIKIEIAGHTDTSGSEEFNMRLSELRAEAVASWLIQNGIPSIRIITKGYGDTKPIADNFTFEGRRKNRRTEILVLDTD
jgi:outer membrane protein OmpA-like peptidoglycan-associated protein/outer membrane protein assembly factor BamB